MAIVQDDCVVLHPLAAITPLKPRLEHLASKPRVGAGGVSIIGKRVKDDDDASEKPDKEAKAGGGKG